MTKDRRIETSSVPFHAAQVRTANRSRGALSHVPGRFETVAREQWDDGWPRDEEPLPPLETRVTEERARSILAKNDSPDIPFDRSINPYRGCEHGCVYCLSGDTPILMADGRTRRMDQLGVGDEIIGTIRKGWYRRYARSRVLKHWSVVKPAYRVTLEDGTELTCGPDHRFLTERGWKYVTAVDAATGRMRPHLTTNNKLMGVGAFACAPEEDDAYRIGYLCGMLRGDAHIGSYRYERAGRASGDQHRFRLALCDDEALQRTQAFLALEGIGTDRFTFANASGTRRPMQAIRTSARERVDRIRSVIEWPSRPEKNWSRGFLAGIFDAEGSFSHGILRISNTDTGIIEHIVEGLDALGIEHVLERTRRPPLKPITVVRIRGGLRDHLQFFHATRPAITRKLDIAGQAVKSGAKLRVRRIDPLGHAMRLYDITTSTEDFIANGVVSHNCYARQTHAYLELSPGLDFETRLFAKKNAAELLREELAKPGYVVEPIAFGTNTDAYQPIERRYRIMRELVELLAACEHPLTVVTKSVLVERDLDLLAPMAAKKLVKVFLSINTLDANLARRLEPRAASPKRRLDAVRALAAAGIPTGVMVAPMIPGLTDKSIEEVLEAAAGAGATMAGWIMLRLPFEVKPLFKEWLDQHYPLRAEHVMSIVRNVRGGRENDPNFRTRMTGGGNYADLIAKRFAIACRRLRLNEERRGNERLDCTRFRAPEAGRQMRLF